MDTKNILTAAVVALVVVWAANNVGMIKSLVGPRG